MFILISILIILFNFIIALTMEKLSSLNNVVELGQNETILITGGAYDPAETVGLGLMSGILFGYVGMLGLAHAYINFFKNRD